MNPNATGTGVLDSLAMDNVNGATADSLLGSFPLLLGICVLLGIIAAVLTVLSSPRVYGWLQRHREHFRTVGVVGVLGVPPWMVYRYAKWTADARGESTTWHGLLADWTKNTVEWIGTTTDDLAVIFGMGLIIYGVLRVFKWRLRIVQDASEKTDDANPSEA